MTDAEIDNLFEKIKAPGPGHFNPKHDITERRPDIGVPDLSKLPVALKEQVKDTMLPLFPNFDHVLPNHLTFKFQQAQRETSKKPRNDYEWKFYQVDLDVVKESITQNMFIGGSKLIDTQEKF